MTALGEVRGTARAELPLHSPISFSIVLSSSIPKKIVHGDIQPGILLMGLDRAGNRVLWTDFGIAHQPMYEEGQSYAALEESTLCGNPPFASLMGHTIALVFSTERF